MSEEKTEPQRAVGIGKDELNLAEFPLSVVGRRPPAGVKTVYFEDETWDRGAKRLVSRRLTVTASDLLGLPTATDEEVLVGCLKLTRDQGFRSPRIEFVPYELLELLGWRRDGRGYRRLSQSLDRWAGTLVISDNAFWHKGQQCWVKDTLSVLDRVRIYRGGDAESDRRSWLVWGDFLWESFQSGNLKTLDYEFWKGLKSPVAKRLYRLLDKRFHHRGEVRFPLKKMAFEKVGLSRKMHTGQVKAKLAAAHDELAERRFCRADYVRLGRGDWEVVYQDLRSRREKRPVAKPAIEIDGSLHKQLQQQLRKRGVRGVERLLRQATPERIRQSIANYDDRVANGQQLGPGWLSQCILDPEPFVFRPGSAVEPGRKPGQAKRPRPNGRSQSDSEPKAQRDGAQRAEAKQRRQEFTKFAEGLQSRGGYDRFVEEAFRAIPLFETLYRDKVSEGETTRAEELRRDAAQQHWVNQKRDKPKPA